MPRYVILEHDHPVRHWDLMLEWGEVLRTWRLVEPPRLGVTVGAEASFDHRPLYLDYEGPLSGGRGTVARWDAGTYSAEEDGAALVLRLDGGRLRGSARLEPAGGAWTFRLEGEAGLTGRPASAPPG
jgi:hypothetical protein